MGNTAGGSVSDFRKMGKQSMEAELSIAAGDTGVTDAVGAIGGVLNTKAAAMNSELKEIYKEKQDAADEFGKKLETAFVDMGPEMENLGQESYQKAQDDVYGLREEFVNCAGDKKCEGKVMVKLNQTKSRHGTDAENAKNLTGLWQGELDEKTGIRGESSADVKAMTKDDKDVMEQFVSNKSKRVEYLDETGTGPGDILNYKWEIPNPNYISEEETPGVAPVVTKVYSNEQLQEMIPIKETVNGEKLQDFIQAEKEKKGNGQTVSDNAALKKAVGDMIPKTKQALKSWAYSNPANQDYLNVHNYLVDHPILDGQYEKLGLEDQPTEPNPNYVEGGSEPEFIGDGVINHEDFIALEDKDAIITKIMDAEDVNLSHEILTDIYASAAGNEISGAGNEEYNPGRHVLSGIRTTDELKKKRKEFFDLISTDLSSFESMSESEIIEQAELTPDEVENGFIYNGKMTTIDNLIGKRDPKKYL